MARVTIEGDQRNSDGHRGAVPPPGVGRHPLLPPDPVRADGRGARVPPVAEAERRLLPQEHQLSPRRGPAQGGRPEGPGRVGADAPDDAGLLDAGHRLHGVVPAAVCPRLEDRLRQLPPDRGGGPQGRAAVAERPDPRRLVPVAPLARRPPAADLHQHPPRAVAGLGHLRPLRATGLAVRGQGGAAAPARRAVEAAEPGARGALDARACRSSIGPPTTSSCSGSTTT